MEDFGTIKKVSIGSDLDTDADKYICEVEFEDKEDIRKIQIINMSGLNSRPRIDQKVLVVSIGCFELGIAIDDNIAADLDDGEFEIYSIDEDGNKGPAIIKIKPDGEIKASNDSGNFMLSSDGQFSANGNLTVDP